MEGEQFSLCWNNFSSNLSSGFHSLLTSEDLVDVTLAAEGKYIKAHKTVLSVCSPYFKELFRVNPCKHPIVILQDVNYEALRSILQFMYKGEVSVNQDEIPVFMKVAELLQIKGLTNNSDINSNGTDDYDSNQESSSSYISKPPALKRPKPSSSISSASLMTSAPSFSKRSRPLDSSPKHDLSTSTSAPPPPYQSTYPQQKRPSSSANVHHQQQQKRPSTAPPPPHHSHHHQQQQSSQPSQSPQLQPTTTMAVEVQQQQPSLAVVPSVVEVATVSVKQEPVDEEELEDHKPPPMMMMDDSSSFGEGMDVSSMLHTSLGEGSDGAGSWSGDATKVTDTSSPGTLQCVLTRKGKPRLIVDGHVFFKKSSYKSKTFWYCRQNKARYRCPAVCWTVEGQIAKVPMIHTHGIVIEPEDDDCQHIPIP